MVTTATIFVGELFGTALLILFGGGVVAAHVLNKSKAKDTGWVLITFGWGFGVMAGAYFALPLSGGHLNPAVTLGLAASSGEWAPVPVYIVAQMLGAMIGAFLVWLVYLAQFKASDGPFLGIFSTEPEVRSPGLNLITEFVATAALLFLVVATGQNNELALSGVGVLIVAFTVVGIGMSLGGPTGYAINPARDLGPRIVHQLLPIKGKGTSDWGYSWVPVLGPLLGGLVGGALGAAVQNMAA
ncbi:MIP/aquaporin family protein [Nocardiopsis composta]|uniref:Glycerol uptake facilitator protein n=1 Tax=Nocardiopsis composta TaxID=157465 RepID=A0A7W8QQL4_9ACTN|nr:MIP/aquaporin family protein [Nocardiopsis composta]MBB5434399.1 glycerol uptake facilitator protein [Nocardiopsis composta]